MNQTAINSQNGPTRRIRLGVPLDLFLDRDENKLPAHEEAIRKGTTHYGLSGGIELPDDTSAGTGNIVIRGRPGSGKSILAMQLAQKCCGMNGDKFFAWFIALEEAPTHVLQKARNFGWEKTFEYIRNLNEFGELTNPQNYGEVLRRILTKHEDACPIPDDQDCNSAGYSHKHGPGRACVYISRLSPRHLSPTEDAEADIFEERLHQLENLLYGASSLRMKHKDLPRLAIVCIDSLNVFGDRLLTREQLYRLFDLFKKNGVIGVFVLEEDEMQVISPDSRLHGDEIEFLGDVVIALQYGEDQGYFVRYFEIVKSRYQPQVYGKHPFKIVKHPNPSARPDPGSDNASNPNLPASEGIVIFPSLHYIVYGTEPVSTGERS